MNFLLAKIKKMKNPAHCKIISDYSTYEFDAEEFTLVEYSPDHRLDEDSLYKISNFKEQSYCLDFLREDTSSFDFNQIPYDKFKEISYLCSFQNDAICFQKVTPSTYLNRKILKLGENAVVESCANKIFINPFPDAVYVPSMDVLVFRNLATISSIFKGIDALYKEATQNEVNSFIAEAFIDLSYDASKVSKPNRKRIALAMETFSRLNNQEREQVSDYIRDYCEDLVYDEEKKSFSISTDKELKYFLYGIEQRFYTTMLGEEKRLANSIQTLR